MPFSDVEVRDHEAALTPFLEKRRPPEPVRDQVDLDYRIEDQTITIFERRALWQSGGETVESPWRRSSTLESTVSGSSTGT